MPGLISEILSGNALLALVAAGLWGVGDFSGGMGVKCAGGSVGAALRVVVLSHITSFSVLVLVAWARGDVFPHGRLLAWGLTAGVAGGLSLCAFYIALSRGAMGASAAISGVLAAGVPAMVTIATEGAPGWRKAIGFVVAGVAIWLIAAGDADHERRSTTWLAIGAGAGFGIYFVALKFAGAGGVIWPMATARMGSISACALLLLAMRGAGSVRITGTVGKWVLATALFDTSGNLMFIAATHAGWLDVAAVLASLYPASTILLAAWRNHERPTRRQGWGMALAGAAVVLIAL
jgi:drug/metabolite transporter (DMT)-like permease